MCYGRGGTQPTVTDAQLVLGRIPPHLLGGEVPLSVDLARKGIEALAAELGLTPERTAEGVLEIAAWNQANAVEQMSVKRGLDPRDYTLVAFGGSGPAPGRPARRAAGSPGGPDPGLARHGLRVRPPHRRPQERLRPDRGPAPRAARPGASQRAPGAAREPRPPRRSRGRACPSRPGAWSASPISGTSARRGRSPWSCRPARSTPRARPRPSSAFTPPTRSGTATATGTTTGPGRDRGRASSGSTSGSWAWA